MEETFEPDLVADQLALEDKERKDRINIFLEGIEPPKAAASNSISDKEEAETSLELIGPRDFSAGPTMRDVFFGLAEALPQTFGGVLDGLENSFDAIDDAGRQIEKIIGPEAWDLVPSSPLTNFEKLMKLMDPEDPIAEGTGERGEKLKTAGDTRTLPEVPKAKTVTGSVIRKIAEFLVGFIPALRMIRKISGGAALFTSLKGIAQTEAAAALASVFVFNPDEKRLSDMLAENTDLFKVVTDHLKTKETDSRFDSRIKNVLESPIIGLTVVTGSAIVAKSIGALVRLIKARRLDTGIDITKVGDPSDTSPLVPQLGDAEGAVLTPIDVGVTVTETISRAIKAEGKKVKKALTAAKLKQTKSQKVLDDLPDTEPVANFNKALDANGENIRKIKELEKQQSELVGKGSVGALRPTVKTKMQDELNAVHEALKKIAHQRKLKIDQLSTLNPNSTKLGNRALRARIADLLQQKDFLTKDLENVIEVPNISPADIPIQIGRGRIRNVPFRMNWAAMTSTEAFGEVQKKVAKVIALDMDKVRRGTISEEQLENLMDDILFDLFGEEGVKDAASQIYMIKGTGYKGEEILALKWMLDSATDDLVDAARMVDKFPLDNSHVYFLKVMRKKHQGALAFTQGAMSEAGRALRATGQLIGPRDQQMADLGAAFSGDETIEDIQRFARAVIELETMTTKDIDKILRGSAGKRISDAISDWWYFSLLSGWRTHVVNASASSINLGWQVGERALAARIRVLKGGGKGVQKGEAVHMLHAMAKVSGQAVRAAGKAFITNSIPDTVSKIERTRPQNITSQNFPIGKFVRETLAPYIPDGPITTKVRGGVEIMGTAITKGIDGFGTMVSVPGRLILSTDEFFGTMARAGQMESLAYRKGAESGLTGNALRKNMDDILRDPSVMMRMSAQDFGRDIAFTSQLGPTGQKFSSLVSHSLLGRLMVPFPRVSINLPKWAGKRTPLAFVSKNVMADIKGGGAASDLALARIGMGTMLGMTIIDLTRSGIVTGAEPFDQELRNSWRLMFKKYSVKIGDSWYGFDRTDPWGMIIGAVASYTQIAGELTPADRDDIAAAIVLATTQSILNKTWMVGVSQFIAALEDPKKNLARFGYRLVGSLIVPTGLAQIKQGLSPEWKEVNSMIEAACNRTPGCGKDMPARRDFWGDKFLSEFGWGQDDDMEIVYADESYEAIGEGPEGNIGLSHFMPFSKFTPKDYPATKWLYENRIGIKPANRTQMGVQLSPKQYDRFLELAGNAAKDRRTGLGFRETMNALVEGTHPRSSRWNRMFGGNLGGQAAMFHGQRESFLNKARKILLAEDSEFAKEVEAVKEQKKRGRREETILIPTAGKFPRRDKFPLALPDLRN